MNPSQILITTGILSSGLFIPFEGQGGPKPDKKPNIIYILSDDLGYGDVSVYNPDGKISTPNIDRLAYQGIRFTDAHSSSAVCTPTRYGILTGRYSWRSPLKEGVLNGYSQSLIEKDRTTVASFLKRNGYVTGVVGKWHLGIDWVQKSGTLNEASQTNSPGIKIINPETLDFSLQPTDGPMDHGFDYSYVLPASLDMPPYCYLENNVLTAPLTEQTPGSDPANGTTGAFWRAGLMARGFNFEQVTPTFTEKAVSFIRKQSPGKPFFLYLPFPSPHTPWLPTAEFRGSSNAGEYGDFVRMVDTQVGKVLQTLTEMGFDDNTIVFFASDNGPFWKPDFIERFNHHAAFIYRGMKADAFEGGHRIPFIVRWPGNIKAGSQCHETVTLTNLLSTCAGIVHKQLTEDEGEDSFSILPLLLDKTAEYQRPEAQIHQSSRGYFAVRKGDWKLITGLGSGGFSKPEKVIPKEGEAPGQLYNLKDDPSENNNLYLQFPEKAAELNAILRKYQEAGPSRITSALTEKNQNITYVNRFENENHPEIGYWFISPNLISDEKKILANIDSIATKCMYTLLFLTSREGANFYDFPVMHPVFRKLVAEGHRKGLKVGLQLWGNYKDTIPEGSQRMIVDHEVTLDSAGNADYMTKAKFIRFPDRLLKSDLFRVFAFRKTSDGFYDPATLTDITSRCEVSLPDKETVGIKIRGGKSVKNLTACVMTQEYCSQSSMWGDVEINGFAEAMKIYSDIPFDGFALDEYGNKFVAREAELGPGQVFRGRWYSDAMAREYLRVKGVPLDKTLFNARYAPDGKPEVRMKAINEYMEFMRSGARRVENAVYKKSREIFGKNIFNGIHNTYHNSLTNDEIWANGIGWWDAPRAYGQTDEKTPAPIQMGVAMAHPENAMYNQYYDKDLEPVLIKAFSDLRYGIRTHYHALNDHRPLRFDLEDADAITGINQIETCTRLMNKFNPSLPEIRLLVIFGMEALSNWYPDEGARGIFDINDKLGIEAKGVEIWNAGFLNAIIPSDLIVSGKMSINREGKPVMNGHTFDAVIYLNPQYAREPVLNFLEEYENKGGKLMLVGTAENDFNGKNISARFGAISKKATVTGYSLENISRLGIRKNQLPDGCKNEDGSYVFTDRPSLLTSSMAGFSVNLGGDDYSGEYKGLAIIAADKINGLKKFAAHGFTRLIRNGRVILSFKNPVDIFISKQNGITEIIVADPSKKMLPLVNEL